MIMDALLSIQRATSTLISNHHLPQFSYQYVKPRGSFGRPTHFADSPVEMCLDVRPNEDHRRQWVVASTLHKGIQAAASMSEHEANTNAVLHTSQSVQHSEGGWPKEVDPADVEHVLRYRKKAEKDEHFVKAVGRLGGIVEEALRENCALDLYTPYFQDMQEASDLGVQPPSLQPVTTLRDPLQMGGEGLGGRSVVYLTFQGSGERLAVAYGALQRPMSGEDTTALGDCIEDGQLLGGTGQPLASSFLWAVDRPTSPLQALHSKFPLCCLMFSPKDTHLLGAGQRNGQLALFDLRKGSLAAECSRPEHSHRDPICDVAWLQSKTGQELMTVSTDGSVLWWDTRSLAQPQETLTLKDRNSDVILGGLCFDYSPAAGPTKFLIGTEQGVVLSCNRKAKSPAERVGTAYSGHHGPVYSVARNPLLPKAFMSVGDWTVRLWNEEVRPGLSCSEYRPGYLMGGKWGTTRPSVFYTVDDGGCIDVWDLYAKQGAPSLTMRASDHPLCALDVSTPSPGGLCMVAAGSSAGSVVLMQPSQGLQAVQPNEKQALVSLLERETARERLLEKQQREARSKARQGGGGGGGAPPGGSAAQGVDHDTEGAAAGYTAGGWRGGWMQLDDGSLAAYEQEYLASLGDGRDSTVNNAITQEEDDQDNGVKR